MYPKLTLSFIFLLATCRGQLNWYPVEGDYTPDDGELQCDRMVCVAPCPGAAPPPYCPRNATNCRSGCACMSLCRRPATVCFQTKFCASRRRYLTRTTTPLQVVADYNN